MRRYAESSAALVTALNPVIGYERAAEVAKRAMAERRTVSEIVREEGLLDDEEIAAAARPAGADGWRRAAGPGSSQGQGPGVGLRVPRRRDDRPRPGGGRGHRLGHLAPFEGVPALGGGDDLAVDAEEDERRQALQPERPDVGPLRVGEGQELLGQGPEERLGVVLGARPPPSSPGPRRR